MSSRGKKMGRILGLLGVMAVVGIGVAVAWDRWGAPRPPQPQPPVPPYSATRFLNTGADARYIGVAACAECHRRNHESYLLTAHSRALADLDPSTEPADVSYEHRLSGRSYRVYRQDGTMRHEEIVRTADGREIARLDVPIRYRIGSGNFTRSYLVEIDGFMYESPLTWYTSKRQWGMSPGYDRPGHWGFERAVVLECIYCHAGHAEAAGESMHRIIVSEKAIGCESCHGPGSLHQARHRQGPLTPGADDLTIVNPGKLSRPLQEAICAVCHHGGTSVHLRGRGLNDFRPGMPLSDVRTDYRIDTGSEQMTVVGHFEQMRQSACYQKSADLTCVTCHDLHARELPKDRVAYYRKKCLSCHSVQACKLAMAERHRKNPADDCVACHMPRGDTEIAHIAFTHHRIGRHPAPQPAALDVVPELVPTEDVAQLAPLDRQRNLGLAYVLAAQNPLHAAHAGVFRQRGQDLLEAVDATGLRDGDVAAALLEIFREKDRDRAMIYARQAADSKGVPGELRASALLLLASFEAHQLNYKSATARLEQAVTLRRYADDWRLLALCYLRQDQPLKALSALQQALAIRPYRASIHRGLADVYLQLSDVQHAAEHQEKGQWLQVHNQD